MSDAAIQARAKQDQIESNKEYVRQQLIIMKEQCVVCKRSTCDGTILLHVSTERVVNIATVVMYIVAAKTII